MKKITIIIFYFVIPSIIFGQVDPDTCSRPLISITSIKTPTNVNIIAYEFGEFSLDCLAAFEDVAADWIDDYDSNAERVAPASATYNCHAYAFHIKDGGNTVWLNAHDDHDDDPEILKKYWSGTSPTYTQTTSASKATIAFYGSCWQSSGGQWYNIIVIIPPK